MPTAREGSDWPWDEQAFGPSARLRRTIRVQVDTKGLERPTGLVSTLKVPLRLLAAGTKQPTTATPPREPASPPRAADDPRPSVDDAQAAWIARGRAGAHAVRELFEEPWNLRGHEVRVSVDDLASWETKTVELDVHVSTETEVTTADSLRLADDALHEAETIMRRGISQAPVELRVLPKSVVRLEARLPRGLAESLRGPLAATLDLPSSDWAEMSDGRMRLCSPSGVGIPRVLAFLGDEERTRRAFESALPPASTTGLDASELRSRFNLFPLALILTMLVAWAVPFGTPAAAAYSALYALLLVVAFQFRTRAAFHGPAKVSFLALLTVAGFGLAYAWDQVLEGGALHPLGGTASSPSHLGAAFLVSLAMSVAGGIVTPGELHGGAEVIANVQLFVFATSIATVVGLVLRRLLQAAPRVDDIHAWIRDGR